MSPLKITFVLPPANLSGGIRVIAIYAERLQQRGHEVQVVSVSRRSLSRWQWSKAWIKARLKGQRLQVPPQWGPSHFDRTTVPHQVLEHAGPVTDQDLPDADVVIATWWETAHWVAALSATKGVKAYFMQDYGIPGQELEQIVPTWLLPLHLITISQWLVTLIQEHCGAIPVTLIPNAVDSTQFSVPPRSKPARPKIGLTYRSGRSKGIDIGLKAFEMAQQTLPSLQLIAFGREYPSVDLPLPPDATYYYCPPDDQIVTLYAECNAWLFTSRLEGFGLPILEAMACRTPVIGTPAGAAPELLTPDVGRLVPFEDPQAMAEAIVKICRLPEASWQSMSKAAYTKATSYTWDEATQRFEAALRHMIQMTSHPSKI